MSITKEAAYLPKGYKVIRGEDNQVIMIEAPAGDGKIFAESENTASVDAENTISAARGNTSASKDMSDINGSGKVNSDETIEDRFRSTLTAIAATAANAASAKALSGKAASNKSSSSKGSSNKSASNRITSSTTALTQSLNIRAPSNALIAAKTLIPAFTTISNTAASSREVFAFDIRNPFGMALATATVKEPANAFPPMDEVSALVMTAKLFNNRSNFYKTMVRFVSTATEDVVLKYCVRNGFVPGTNSPDIRAIVLLPMQKMVEQLEHFKKIILENTFNSGNSEEFLCDQFYHFVEFQLSFFEPLIKSMPVESFMYNDYFTFKAIAELLKPHLSENYYKFQTMHGLDPEATSVVAKSLYDAKQAVLKFHDCAEAIRDFCIPKGVTENTLDSIPQKFVPLVSMLGNVSEYSQKFWATRDKLVPTNIPKSPTQQLEVGRITLNNARKMFAQARKLEEFIEVLNKELALIKEISSAEEKLKNEKLKEEQAILELNNFKRLKEAELAAFKKDCLEKQKSKEAAQKAKIAAITKLYNEQEKVISRLDRDLTEEESQKLASVYTKLEEEERITLNKLLQNPSKLNRVTFSDMETLIGRKLPDGNYSGLKGKLIFNDGSHGQIQLPNIFIDQKNDDKQSEQASLLSDIDIPKSTMGGVDKAHGKDRNNGKLPYSSHYLCQEALNNAGFTVKNLKKLQAVSSEKKPASPSTSAASITASGGTNASANPNAASVSTSTAITSSTSVASITNTSNSASSDTSINTKKSGNSKRSKK